jgi:RNA polymerase sigma-70 factor (ECF subfamily)
VTKKNNFVFLSQSALPGVDHQVATGPEPTEIELVTALRRKEARAFDAVYARYRVRIYSFLVRLAGRRDVADDLFQETFLQLARHAHRLEPDTELGAFLYTVARNRYRNHRRMSLFRLGRLRELFAGRSSNQTRQTVEQGAPESATPFDQAAASDTARRLEQALATLSPPLREALLLVAVEGLAAEAAAQVLGIAPAALRQRLARARAQLASVINLQLAGAGPGQNRGDSHDT